MTSLPEIRRALGDDRTRVVEMVIAAFRHDPAWAFLTADRYQQLAPRVAATLFDLRVGTGNVWVTHDLSAVAMWKAPGTSEGPAPRAEEIWARYRAAAGARACERLDVYNTAVAAASSASPHWYLGVLATHPARQGEGLATAVIEPVLREADRDDLACCLETSTKANRRFYERRGFTEATEVIIPSGPPTWWLRRPPGPRSLAT
jgi:GNAT superfamily N-acetyltransferase